MIIIIVANFSKTNELETRAARLRTAYLAYKWVYFGTKCDSLIFIDIIIIISSGVSESSSQGREGGWGAGDTTVASLLPQTPSTALPCAWSP